MAQPDRVLVFCQATAAAVHHSGIHRVSVELVRALSDMVPTSLVCWDTMEGQLRFMDHRETLAVFRDGIPDGIRAPLQARSVQHRFGDLIFEKNVHLLFPEISYHLPRGNEMLSRIIAQCREYRIPVSGIYYDAIPVTNASYSELRRPHIDYLTELTRFDRLFPISRFSSDAFMQIFRSAGVAKDDLENFQDRVQPILLPEGQNRPRAATAVRDGLLMVGTVEPRKQQLQVMQAINTLRDSCPAIASMRVDVVGALHPDTARPFLKEIARNPLATFHNQIGDYAVEALYDRAAFSVFASYDEGYGLPIAESLVRGVPCLTASFGSMVEIACGGGCLTVDVMDADELQSALRLMAEDTALLACLQEQISTRIFRTWQDYARDVLDGMIGACSVWPKRTQVTLPQPLAFAKIALDASGKSATDSLTWMVGAPADHPGAVHVVATAWTGPAQDIGRMSKADFDELCAADVLGVNSDAALDEICTRARNEGLQGLLPTHVVTEVRSDDLVSGTYDALCQAAQSKARRLKFASEERLYCQVRRHFAPQGETELPILSLVISTYNRSTFVQANAGWLADQIERFKGKVTLTVVDNASTDDSWARLQELQNRAHVWLVQNPTNVGMLGNLRVCSTLPLARHVWVTGDDDFITSETLDAVVAHLEQNPGMVLGVVNFAVYHRHVLSPYDTPKLLQSEGISLSKNPAPDGIRRVCDIAGEHDNLFTAVYPIIFRSDVLAACFNYSFQGVPFVDLVESVPTTKIILESYGQCEASWFSSVGTVGNAHNSWSRHRPRWHALLMPLVIELARDAGVDQQKLRCWADAHWALFEEATVIARGQDMPVHFDGDTDLQPGRRVFLKPVVVADDLRRWENPASRIWDGR